VEAETIVPARFLQGVDGITVAAGNRILPLTDVFLVEVEGTAADPSGVEVVLRGDNSRLKRIGEYMEAGKIRVEGNIGMHCGNFMKGARSRSWRCRRLAGPGDAGREDPLPRERLPLLRVRLPGEKHGMRGGTWRCGGTQGISRPSTWPGARWSSGGLRRYARRGDEGGDPHDPRSCTRPCGNMTGGTCTVWGVPGDAPTFRRTGTVVHEPGGVILTRFEGDVANRGKGTLLAREWQYTL